ncbi:hypothetical protein MKD49_11260 [Herbaspirillum sp. WGmk3]|uniref:hypothetical protein n=1 Tax=Herbaspirillum sp. WGmk3 TaxID=2919925 RepID=UPI0020916C48|nr:hypothetical protein [Herbaspirillum sp. WGmk3]MCO4857057.1 hypothetical protein [Herbaspirillum sp. WGmk3]
MKNVSPTHDQGQSRLLSIFCSLLIAGGLVFVLLAGFGAYWGNDDAGMAMIAHGYGIAAFGSPNIVFSNVLWGHFVRAIPSIDGLDGYSVAMIGVLFVVTATTIYGLRELKTSITLCTLIAAFLFVRPVLFPQFTINAGLLGIAGVICLLVFIRERSRAILLLGAVLLFTGYLIRSREVLFVLLVSAPLVPWRNLIQDRVAKFVIGAFFAAVLIAAIVDYQAYQTASWATFNETSKVISPIVDFGAGALLRQHPAILQAHGYSTNDIDLLINWFFVDLNILDVNKLKQMLAELGPLPTQANSLSNAMTGIRFLWNKELIAPMLAALFMLFVLPSRRVFISWIIFLAGIFTLGLMGRPGILHVYIPLAGLLLTAPFLIGPVPPRRARMAIIGLAVVLIPYTINLCIEANTAKSTVARIQKDLTEFPSTTVVNWASSFPFQAAYPFLGRHKADMPFRLYSLGGLAQAPYMNTFVDQSKRQGVPDLLASESGMKFIAIAPYFDLLAKYCEEHLHGDLQEISVHKYGDVEVSQRRCNVRAKS